MIEGGHPLYTLREPPSGVLKDYREELQAPHYTALERDAAK